MSQWVCFGQMTVCCKIILIHSTVVYLQKQERPEGKMSANLSSAKGFSKENFQLALSTASCVF